jgi:hypothetical protein
MATSSHLHPTNTSLVARGNVIITKEGDDLDLIPPTNKLSDFLGPIDDLQRRSDELRNTWPSEFSLPGLP